MLIRAMRRRTLVLVIATVLVLVAGIVILLGFILGSPGSQTVCFNPGVSCPAGEDIVNGPITVNASQYNYYQFSIQYGTQNLNVHAQWSSGGSIGVYIVNATELIDWQTGHGLRSFYNSGQVAQGDVNLRVPSDDLYYLVFDNTFSTVAKNVVTSAGFSFMCRPGLCGATPIRQLNPSYPTCVPLNGNEVCSMTLSNTGTLESTPTGTCIQSWSLHEGPFQTWGVPREGVFHPTTAISPSFNITGTCTVTGTTAPLGLAITLLIPFTNGQNVMMYGPVSLNSPTCTQSGTNLDCNFRIENSVMPGVTATDCQIAVGDNVTRWKGTVGGTTAFNSENRGAMFTCSVLGSEPIIGTPVTGFVRFSNGSYAPFSSMWS